MSLIMQRVKALLGQAMALQMDAEIWWLGLEEHHKTHVGRTFLELIDTAKPRYIPRRLWNYWHRGGNG